MPPGGLAGGIHLYVSAAGGVDPKQASGKPDFSGVTNPVVGVTFSKVRGSDFTVGSPSFDGVVGAAPSAFSGES